MRVIETLKTSQCQGCGAPPRRCKCNNTTLRQQIHHTGTNFKCMLATTEKLQTEGLCSNTTSPEITIKNTFQELSDRDSLPDEMEFTCPRCITLYKHAQESQLIGPMRSNVCKHCQIRAQTNKLKAEKGRAGPDKQKEHEGKKKMRPSHIGHEADISLRFKSRSQTDVSSPDKLHKLKDLFSEKKILQPETMMPKQQTTKVKMFPSESNLIDLSYQDGQLTKPIYKEKKVLILFDRSKISTFRSDSTISNLTLEEVKHRLLSSGRSKEPSDVIKTKELFQTSEDLLNSPLGIREKEKRYEMAKDIFGKPITSTPLEDILGEPEEVLKYIFPKEVKKKDSINRNISSAELIRNILRKNGDKYQKQKEINRLKKIEEEKKKLQLTSMKQEESRKEKDKETKKEEAEKENKMEEKAKAKLEKLEIPNQGADDERLKKGQQYTDTNKKEAEAAASKKKLTKLKQGEEDIKKKKIDEVDLGKKHSATQVLQPEDKKSKATKKVDEVEKNKKEDLELLKKNKADDDLSDKLHKKDMIENKKGQKQQSKDKGKEADTKDVKRIKERKEDDKQKQYEEENYDKMMSKLAKDEEDEARRKKQEEEEKKRQEEEKAEEKRKQEEKEKQALAMKEAERIKQVKLEEERKRKEEEAERKRINALDEEVYKMIKQLQREKELQRLKEQNASKKNKDMWLENEAKKAEAKKKLEKGNEAANDLLLQFVEHKEPQNLMHEHVQQRLKQPEYIIIGENINLYKTTLSKDPLLQQLREPVIPLLFNKKYSMQSMFEPSIQESAEKEGKSKDKKEKQVAEKTDEVSKKRESKQKEKQDAEKTDEVSKKRESKQCAEMENTKIIRHDIINVNSTLLNTDGPNKNKEKQVAEKTDEVSKKRESIQKAGIMRYALSDRTFIDKGWTVLPVEEVVRKLNVYRMRPAHPEFDWFTRNKNRGVMTYETGEKLAEFDPNGRCRWYYKSGRVALDYYDSEKTHAQHRFVVYSNGEPDERGRARPYTVLATFSYQGNGAVFDHGGKIRLKYNQSEGVVLDRGIGPVTTWKWHSLNDPPVLQQIMKDSKLPQKDQHILKLGDKEDHGSRKDDADMVAIEHENAIKEMHKKQSLKYKPFEIRTKAMKINENFSLKVLDQATIYLYFREGSTNIKLNIGMVLDNREIVDTDITELGSVSTELERFPAATDSIASLQRTITNAQRFERNRTLRERLLQPLPPNSADLLTAHLSRPLKPKPMPIPSQTSSKTNFRYRKPQTCHLYYNSRLA